MMVVEAEPFTKLQGLGYRLYRPESGELDLCCKHPVIRQSQCFHELQAVQSRFYLLVNPQKRSHAAPAAPRETGESCRSIGA